MKATGMINPNATRSGLGNTAAGSVAAYRPPYVKALVISAPLRRKNCRPPAITNSAPHNTVPNTSAFASIATLAMVQAMSLRTRATTMHTRPTTTRASRRSWRSSTRSWASSGSGRR